LVWRAGERQPLPESPEGDKMTKAEKSAISTAYDFFKNPGEYPLVDNPNSAETNAIIAGAIYSFFTFDDAGNVIEISKETVEKFNNLRPLKGLKF